MTMERIPVAGAEIYYNAQFLEVSEASGFFEALLSKCSWRRHKTSFGSAVPRDEAYYGDPGTHYTYSRREYKPLAWIPELLTLRERVQAVTPVYENLRLPMHGYNAVLCNLYRDGNDSVGLHADDEPEMGPVIASLSIQESISLFATYSTSSALPQCPKQRHRLGLPVASKCGCPAIDREQAT